MKTKMSKPSEIVDRELIIHGMKIHIKSIFGGEIPIEKALANIARRKLEQADRNNKR